MSEGFERAVTLLPPELRGPAMALSPALRRQAEELRLRIGQRPTVLLPWGEQLLPGVVEVRQELLLSVLELATGASAHAAMDSLRQGFVTAAGGCRVGFCGQAVVVGGAIHSLRNLSSAAIRIPRQIFGCADGLLSAGELESLLLISPPGGGKTTLLRELVRQCALAGYRVALADERGEVAGMWHGGCSFDLGPRTDVLTGAPKAEAAMLLLRGMNPQILALDEITAPADVAALEHAAHCGVTLLATAHAASVAELQARPLYRRLLDLGVFRRAVVLRRDKQGRRTFDTETLP